MAARRNLFISITTRVVVCALLLGVGLSVFTSLVRSRPKPEMVSTAGAGRSVPVMTVRPTTVRRTWSGFGTAQAIDSADVPAEVGAIVAEVPEGIVVGAIVNRDDVLARLDDTDFKIQEQITNRRLEDLDAQLDQIEVEEASWTRRVELAEQDVALAQADYERVLDTLERGAAVAREVDQLKQKLVAAIRIEVEAKERLNTIAPRRAQVEAKKLEQDAALRLATKNVERCIIRSPITGVLQQVDIEQGENLTVGARCARVVDMRRMEVPLRLAASARAYVRPGDEVRLASTGSDGRTWDGAIIRIAPEDDAVQRTMSVYVEVDQDPGDASALLAPGKHLEGIVTTAGASERWIVPRRAVVEGRVMLIEDGIITSRAVRIDYTVRATFPELGVDDTQWVVLRDPLIEGMQLVLNPSRTLREGAPARPVLPTPVETARRQEILP